MAHEYQRNARPASSTIGKVQEAPGATRSAAVDGLPWFTATITPRITPRNKNLYNLTLLSVCFVPTVCGVHLPHWILSVIRPFRASTLRYVEDSPALAIANRRLKAISRLTDTHFTSHVNSN